MALWLALLRSWTPLALACLAAVHVAAEEASSNDSDMTLGLLEEPPPEPVPPQQGFGGPPLWSQLGMQVELPAGPWKATAQDVNMRGNRLCARLRVEPGGPWASDCVAVQVGQAFENDGGSFRVVLSPDLPGGTWSLTAEEARLEGKLLIARLQRRNQTWTWAHTYAWDGIYLENIDGEFTLSMQACVELDCLHGYVLRYNSTYIYCKYLSCSPITDKDTCCEPAMHCSNYSSCVFPDITDPNNYCLATTCDEARDTHCCVPSAACGDLERCVLGYTKIPGGEATRCPRISCDPELDRDTCCTTAAACTDLTGRDCPHAYYFNVTWWCDGVACDEARDRNVCCLPALACNETGVEICTLGYVRKPDDWDLHCYGTVCDADRDKEFCCDNAAPCSNITCPYGFTTLPNTFCAGVVCDPSTETGSCCHPQAPCTDLVGRECPHGDFFNTTDFCASTSCVEDTDRSLCCQVAEPCTDFSCPFGRHIKPDAQDLFCNGTFCELERDVDACCDIADPCTSLVCPLSLTRRNETLYCLGPACELPRDRDVCCESAGVCSIEYVCPHGYTPRNGTFCDGPTCEVDRDRDNCCDPAMPCTNVTCPRNHIHTPDHYCPATTCIYERDVFHCCEQGVPLRFIRFVPLSLRDITADDNFRPVCQLTEFTPYFHGRRTALVTATAYSTNGDFPPHETPNEAIDDDLRTKWLDYEMSSFTIEYREHEPIDTITLTTGNDAPRRDPMSWRIEGSNDGVLFVLIHEMDDASAFLTLDRLMETQHFRIAVPCLEPLPEMANAELNTCVEGGLIASGSLCTPRCANNYTPSVPSLNCTNGELIPETFLCNATDDT